MESLNNKVISTSIGGTNLFIFDRTPYKLIEGKVVPIGSNAPEKFTKFTKLCEKVDNIIVDSDSIVLVENNNEYELMDGDVFVNGEPSDDVPLDILETLETLEDSKILDIETNDDGKEEFEVGDEKIILDEETEEPIIPEEEPEPTEEEIARDNEIQLILDKIGDLNENILRLEAMDMSQRDDIQEVYIDEMGKKSILLSRLKELGYDYEDPKKSIVDSLVESENYATFTKSKRKKFLKESKKGHLVLNTIVTKLKEKLIESLSSSEKVNVGEITIDKAIDDDKYLVTDKNDTIIVDGDDSLIEFIDEKIDDDFDDDTAIVETPQEPIQHDVVVVGDTTTDEPNFELCDNNMYGVVCDIYKNDENGELLPYVDKNNSIYLVENTVLRYNKPNNIFLDENNNIHQVDKKFIEPIETVEEEQLVPGTFYEHIQTKTKVKFVESIDSFKIFKDSMGEYHKLDERLVAFAIKK